MQALGARGCSLWCVWVQALLVPGRACILAAFCCHVSPSSCRLRVALRCSRPGLGRFARTGRASLGFQPDQLAVPAQASPAAEVPLAWSTFGLEAMQQLLHVRECEAFDIRREQIGHGTSVRILDFSLCCGSTSCFSIRDGTGELMDSPSLSNGSNSAIAVCPRESPPVRLCSPSRRERESLLLLLHIQHQLFRRL